MMKRETSKSYSLRDVEDHPLLALPRRLGYLVHRPEKDGYPSQQQLILIASLRGLWSKSGRGVVPMAVSVPTGRLLLKYT